MTFNAFEAFGALEWRALFKFPFEVFLPIQQGLTIVSLRCSQNTLQKLCWLISSQFSARQQTKMEPKHYPDALRHLEKQNEVLMEAYRSLSYELRRLQVEEEMLMRKFYAVMLAQHLNKKTENTKKNTTDEGPAGEHQVN